MTAVLEARGLSKLYGSFKALDGASMVLQAGQIRALVGENGAGKSTLIRLLSGASQPSGGSILVNGATVRPASPAAAAAYGIGVVHQERHLIPGFSVAENIFLGEMPRTRLGLVDYPTANRLAAAELGRLVIQLDPQMDVSRLSAAQQQMVEIARGVRTARRVLILDEPTASITAGEAEHLFELLRRLATQGLAILFVSHKIEEVYALCDTVSVLRDGQVVETDRPLAELSISMLIEAMVGRAVTLTHRPRHVQRHEPPRLHLANVSTTLGHRNVTLSLFAGEIHGIYGLVGSGRTELAKAILGDAGLAGGSLRFDGVEQRPKSVASAVRDFGLGYVSEDRKGEGLALSQPIRMNAAAAAWQRLASWGWITGKTERQATRGPLADLSLSARSLDAAVSTLSGGNQQKVSVAKWLVAGSEILLVDEPTIGVDLPSKQALHEHIRALADRGKAVLVITSDLPELVAISDRVSVMVAYQIADCFENSGEYPTMAARIMGVIQTRARGASASPMPSLASC